MTMTIPKKKARPETRTAAAARVRCASVMRTATSARMIAAGASSPGRWTSAMAESTNENAQRKPATRSARRASCSIVLTRAPGRRRLPPGGARLRRRLTPLAAPGSPGPYQSYCALRPRTASDAPGTRGGTRLAEAVSLKRASQMLDVLPREVELQRLAHRVEVLPPSRTDDDRRDLRDLEQPRDREPGEGDAPPERLALERFQSVEHAIVRVPEVRLGSLGHPRALGIRRPAP